MAKQDEPQELAPLSDGDIGLVKVNVIDVSDLMWQTRDEGFIPLKMMPDSHLRNTALMLMGMGYQQYNADDDLKVRWLTAIRMEWEKRIQERKARFNGKPMHPND
jgi:hypothetical protein